MNGSSGQCFTFRWGMAILGRHPDLNRTGAVVGLNVRGEEWREADERGEKGSSSPSMGFCSSPPLCWREEKRIKDASSLSQLLPKFQKSYQRGLLTGGGQPEQLTCPGNPSLQTQACRLRQCRGLRRLGGWPEGRHLTMWSQWRAALLLLQTDGLE